MYDYRVEVLNTVDADTFHVGIDLGFDTWQNHTIRLAHINAPEMSTEEGKAAKVWVMENIVDRIAFMRSEKDHKEKYGRYLGTFYDSSWNNLNDEIVANGYAVAYEGGKRS